MKALDLGAHDGYVGAYILDQWEGNGLVIDGVELNAEACRRARLRLNGEVKQGAAEDAPTLFEPGTYDAVYAFELIEHVPDIDDLLYACERMLKPGGLVFLSTPDGTFGTGQNPHHLRALRSIDLAEIVRRRGRLDNMAVGGDGITVCSYSPAKKARGELAIFLGPGWEGWGPQDIVTKGLGGSETAAVRLALALSQIGWVVTVYGETDPQGAFKDVVFRHHTAFDPTVRRDVVISSRMPEIFDRLVNAEHRLLWLHDTDCADRLTPERAAKIDDVLVLSQWHRDHVAQMYPFLGQKVKLIRNGLHLKMYKPQPWESRADRVVYSSSPDRGLDLLLEWWPLVREKVPNAELHFAYADVYNAVAAQNPALAAFRSRVAQLVKKTEGAVAHGSLSQPALADLMAGSKVWAHPSFASLQGVPFNETFCIGAAEAQASGCEVVAANWGGLPEIVRNGRLVGPDSTGRPVKTDFVHALVEALTGDGPPETNVDDLSWDGVAEMIDDIVA
jgi:glycosyltransferase involved in cell wall biosynthesis